MQLLKSGQIRGSIKLARRNVKAKWKVVTMVMWVAGKCYMFLIECVCLGVCDVHRVSVMGECTNICIPMCWCVYWVIFGLKWKSENAPRCVCPCGVPVPNAERGAPSSEAGAACQCCPSGTDTRGASGLLNRLPGWAGSHTSRDTERERGRERERQREGEEQEGWRKKTAGN